MRFVVVMLAVCACDAASPDPGLGAALQIPGAQFRPGPFPKPSGGPAALSAVTTHQTVVIGREHERLHGILGSRATAAIVGIDGADGTWIVPAGPPDIDTPGSPTVSFGFGIARDSAPGPFTIAIAAVDLEGDVGAPVMVDLMALPELAPDGDLVFALTWDSTADLDLHVVDPLGHEAWSGDPNTWQPPPPGQPADPDAWRTGGILDHDGNR
ncbi:MAG: hypothetical protein JWO36_4152, partial [Myxococcales bacterium]|nr:hypothetical protein [Myxococcales bacterium]